MERKVRNLRKLFVVVLVIAMWGGGVNLTAAVDCAGSSKSECSVKGDSEKDKSDKKEESGKKKKRKGRRGGSRGWGGGRARGSRSGGGSK